MPIGSFDRFGYEWDRYAGLRPADEVQFLRWLPFLQPADWRGLRFFDVGCGMGRNSFWPMTYGAAGGKAIDLDPRSLAVARRTLARFPQVEVTQQSAYDDRDVDRARFDIAFCIGVLNHLEHPAAALRTLVNAVRPGGRVAIWVYGRENNEWLLRYFDPLRRHLFSRLPVRWLHALALPPSTLLWLALRLGFAPNDYFELLRQFDLKQVRFIVFDQMLPRIARYFARAEVAALMQEAGLLEVELAWVNQVSWAAVGRRPASTA